MLDKIEHNLRVHQDFPTRMGIGLHPKQFDVNTFEEFLNKFYMNMHHDVYARVHTDFEKNKLFFDFDSKNIYDVFYEVKDFYTIIAPARVYFSGSKGFHVYVDFEPTQIDNFGMRVGEYIKQFKFKYLDIPVVKDEKRIARVPYTINSKSGKMMIPIDIEASTPEHFVLTDIVRKKNNSVLRELMDIDLPEMVNHEYHVGYDIDYIIKYGYTLVDGRKNFIWKILIPTLVHAGYDDSTIINIVSEYITAVGTKFHNVNYHVSRVRKFGFLPISIQRFEQEYL